VVVKKIHGLGGGIFGSAESFFVTTNSSRSLSWVFHLGSQKYYFPKIILMWLNLLISPYRLPVENPATVPVPVEDDNDFSMEF
jgi:hypothetical protein